MTERNPVLNRLIRKLKRRGQSEADAQDLLQEAWLRTLEYSREEKVHNVEAFVERTANNLAIDRYRHAKRYPHEKEDIFRLEQRFPLKSPARNPHEVWADDQRLCEVRGALNELLERTGDIFVLHRVGYSYKELSVEFKLSESAIEKRIARAMLWLMNHQEEPG
jgi:RNA polymerase sigma-70 factor (ECF subfamily)